jgi:hypothetical protein
MSAPPSSTQAGSQSAILRLPRLPPISVGSNGVTPAFL